MTNFECTFSIVSKDGSPFEAAIVSQSQIDSGDDFPFKPSNNGVFGGNVVMDKNIYQNFYLAMHSPTTNVVEVEIEFKRLPEYIAQQDSGILIDKSSKSDTRMKILMATVLLVVLVGIVYMMTKSSTSDSIPSIPTARDMAPKESLLSTLKQVPLE